MLKTCVSFAEEKIEISIAVTATQTNEFEKSMQMEGAKAGFCFCFWNGCGVFNYGCFIKSGDHIVSSSSVLEQHIRCL
jgi:hypothetical protein